MVSFTRANPVAAGQPITSTQLANLADAFNDRIRSGVADNTQRIFASIFSAFRQMRNPSSEGFFPAQGEFFNIYQMLEAQFGQWPVAPAGEFEGANVVNPLCQFVFGSEHSGQYGEAGRLSYIQYVTTDDSPSTKWEAAKAQRGAIDPSTGDYSSPSFAVARSFAAFTYASDSPYGNTSGGYLPGPEYIGECDVAPTDGYSNYDIFLTSLVDGSTVHYGTCPLNPGDAMGVYQSPWTIYVFLWDDSIVKYSTSQWIQGPYSSSPQLRRTATHFIDRVTSRFSNEYRGTEAQRATGEPWMGQSFGFQSFYTRQYQLAPAKGQTIDGLVIASYPSFTTDWTGTLAAATVLAGSQGGPSVWIEEGYVVAGLLITGSNIADSVTIEILDGETVYETFTAQAVGGSVESIHIMSDIRRPQGLGCRVKNSVGATSGTASIRVEFSELVAYLPQFQDAYLVLRVAGGLSDPTITDGRGIDESNSKAIWEDYRDSGCIISQHQQLIDQSDDAINQNGFYDAARRMSQYVRSIRRENFLAYEVAGGVSILYFKPEAYGVSTVNLFDGIAPSRDPVTTIIAGRTYKVRSGSVTYAGTPVTAPNTFTGIAGDSTFTGSGLVYEWNGIRHTADLAGETNEWVIDFTQQIYRPRDDASIFKPEAFADFWQINDRCVAGSFDASTDKSFRSHAHMAGLLTPFPAEVTTSNRYAPILGGTQQVNGSLACGGGDVACQDFQRAAYYSCRIYETPIEIDTAEIMDDGNIKLTMKTRVHHDPSALGTISKDTSTWVAADIAAEPSRTTENALREYLLHMETGSDCTMGNYSSGMAGNQPLRSDAIVTFSPDSPSGACYTSFQFTKLIPKPYEDGNNAQNIGTDSQFRSDPLWQMELYIRAMAEGYVDGQSSTVNGCGGLGVVNLYDFTFENLCFQAFGLSGFTRFGPVPNMTATAVGFNQFVSAINLLDSARIMFPINVQMRERISTGQVAWTPDWPAGTTCTFPLFDASTRAIGAVKDPGVAEISDSGWVDLTDHTSTASIGVFSGGCSGSDWTLEKIVGELESRVLLQNEDHRYALPPTISDFDSNGAGAVLFTVKKTNTVLHRRQVSTAIDSDGCTPAGVAGSYKLYDPGLFIGYAMDATTTVEPTICTLDPNSLFGYPAPSGDVAIQGNPSSLCGFSWDADFRTTLAGGQYDGFIRVPLV